jgi:hypothetical protein
MPISPTRKRIVLAALVLLAGCGSSGSEGAPGNGSGDGGPLPTPGTGEVLAKLGGFDNGGDAPFGITVDGASVYVAVFKAASAVIARVPKAGGALEPLVKGPGSAAFVALDGGRLYFDDKEKTSIASVTIAGGDRRELATATGADALWVAPPRVYFAHANVGSTGRVGWVPIDGGAVTELLKNDARPLSLTLDGSSLFVGHLGPTTTATDQSQLLRVDVTAGTITTVVSPIAGVRALVHDESSLYATLESKDDGQVVAIDKASGAVRVLATKQIGAWGLVLDGSDLYWVNRGSARKSGSVQRMSKAGGQVAVLADGQGEPRRLAVDATHVYWTNFGTGEIMRAPK